DYSRPSHEGYRNTIELPEGNNVVPLRFDTIRLVQNGCSFHKLRSEDPNQLLKDFLKLVDSLDLDGKNKERTRGRTAKLHNDMLMFQQQHGESLSEAWTRFKDLLKKVPHHGIDLWLQVQIFYDHIDCTTQKGIDYATGGRLRKLRPDKAWDTIVRLAQYKNEGWNDTFTSDEVNFSYENPNVEQLLKIIERKVDILMKDVISLMGNSKGIFQLTTNQMCQPPTEPSQQEEFEHIVMNFIYAQEERIKQLKITCMILQMSSWNSLRRDEQREISLLEFGWRIGLYTQEQATENTTLGMLINYNTVHEDRLLMEFWPRIGNGLFTLRNTKLHGGMCVSPGVVAMEKEDDEADDEEVGGDVGHREAKGSANPCRNMSQGDWQAHQAHWMGQQDERWGRIDTWMRLYLMRIRLEVLRKFHWMIIRGCFNQLSHVSSPLLSKPKEY
nr:zinc finger, CCHC-type [Tanacetum cinerariifolium]